MKSIKSWVFRAKMVLKSKMDDVWGHGCWVTLRVSEMNPVGQRWLDSLMEGFNSQFGYKIIWIRKNIFHRHLLNRLTNGGGKLLHEVPVKTPGDFPFIKVWIGEISRSNHLYVHHQTRFPSSAKIAKTELKPTHFSHVRNFLPLKTTYIGHVKWNNWRKRNVKESFELHAGLKRRSSLEGRK